MTRKQIAAKGGQAVVAKYGRGYMSDLAHKWHDKYKLVPYDGNDFLIVNRQTGAVNRKTLNGASYAQDTD
jgi:hypothetical protein